MLRAAVVLTIAVLGICGVGESAFARDRAPGVPGDAPDWTAMEHTARAVHALTTDQAAYFQPARAASPVRARAGATGY